MAHGGNNDGGQRREAQADQQWRGDGYRHAEASHALQKGAEDPAEKEGL
jgi:hypothetical protein